MGPPSNPQRSDAQIRNGQDISWLNGDVITYIWRPAAGTISGIKNGGTEIPFFTGVPSTGLVPGIEICMGSSLQLVTDTSRTLCLIDFLTSNTYLVCVFSFEFQTEIIVLFFFD